MSSIVFSEISESKYTQIIVQKNAIVGFVPVCTRKPTMPFSLENIVTCLTGVWEIVSGFLRIEIVLV